MRLKVGVTRKQARADDGSVGATCEIEVEIPGGATDAEVLRIRDRWLEVCETTVDQELDRLGAGTVRRAPVASRSAETTDRSKPAPGRFARPEDRGPAPPRAHRDARENHGDETERTPIDGRQLLGWAAKQDPDAKDLVFSFGRRKGYPSKIVEWDEEQVRAAYRHAKGQQGW